MIVADLPSLERSILESVRASISSYDASHDIDHILRVYALAVSIANGEGVVDANTLFIIRLSALLHDVGDAKYSDSETAADEAVSAILRTHGIEGDVVAAILHTVGGVSFQKEVAVKGAAPRIGSDGARAEPTEMPLALRIVQDADRLDAIGAVGIARCFTFGAARARPLYGSADLDAAACAMSLERALTPAECASRNATTLGHFWAKLLRLQTMMKTTTGARLARERHAFMESFLSQFVAEVKGER